MLSANIVCRALANGTTGVSPTIRDPFIDANGDPPGGCPRGESGGALAGPRRSPYSRNVSPLRARVEKGRLILDEPTTLPDGTVIDLVADDEGDDLTDEERQALHDALSASWISAEAGRVRPASEILNELRRRR